MSRESAPDVAAVVRRAPQGLLLLHVVQLRAKPPPELLARRRILRR